MGLVLEHTVFKHNCIIISLTKLITELNVYVVIIFLGCKMANFFQTVFNKIVGSYTRGFTVFCCRKMR